MQRCNLIAFYKINHRIAYSSNYHDNQQDEGLFLVKSLSAAVNNEMCSLIESIKSVDNNATDYAEYDFIIIGAGSAGCVLANRLSENPSWRVLLLEAGGDPPVTSEIPALYGPLQRTYVDWQYLTEPEPTNCLGSVNKRCFWPRGKVLGGSSTINAMLYVRGVPSNFDGWEQMGNQGWGYQSMLKYFKKFEDMRDEAVIANANFHTYHNRGGLQKIESFRNNVEFFNQTFTNAFHELGFQSYNDVNAGNHIGYFPIQGFLENGRRCSTAKAYLLSFQSRKNLIISKNSLATKILVGKNKVAHGVQFEKFGWITNVKATKEVILSAGSINSPQLLMLSGIGRKEDLKTNNIKAINDLPVGYNLQDHLLMRGFIMSLNISELPPNLLEDTFDFLVKNTGNFVGVSTFSLHGFISTSKHNETDPNIQFYFESYPPNSLILKASLTVLGYNEIIQSSISYINSKRFTLFMVPCGIQPKSRGRVVLKSTNPEDHPSIYPGYYTQEEDIREMLEAISFANKFANTNALKKLDARVERIMIPECNKFEFQTQEYWRCTIMHMSVTVYHQVGTCMMGPRSNKNAVVDPYLRVHGIKHLRVIDGSIMPNVTSGNTNAPIIAIAERGADLIKDYWQQYTK